MTKLITHHLNGAFGIDIFPMISLAIFVGIFIWMMFWVSKRDKSYINEMKNLPVDDNGQGNQS